jgi:adenosylhomocysteine nucleosidase
VIIGIVVALPEELATLSIAFPSAGTLKKGAGQRVYEHVMIAYSGVGSGNARLAAQWLSENGANCLMSWGCAAALDSTLKAGDLVITDTIVTAQNYKIAVKTAQSDALIDTFSAHLPARYGTIAESEKIIASSFDKNNLFLQTRAIALDMESGTIAREAQALGLPFLAVRAIADTAAMTLPPSVSYALDENGQVVKLRLLKGLVLSPGQLPNLIKLGVCFKAAAGTLKQAARYLKTL